MLDVSEQQEQQIPREPLIISDLKAGSTVRGWLLVVESHIRTTVNRKPYLHLKLRDPRGNEIIARQFDPPQLNSLTFEEGKVVLIEASVEEFRNQPHLKLIHAEHDESAPTDLFTLGTRRPIAQLEISFQRLLLEVEHPDLSELLRCCFTPELLARFCRWPAAIRHHGAITGGLLEHTVNVATIAKRFSQLYPCNSSLVLAGALLHDIGKLEELEERPGAGLTSLGRMVGHIILGTQYVQKQAQQLDHLDQTILSDVLHIILAHHGTLAFGSPVCPATIEALIVHQADVAEAQLTGFLEYCQRNAGPDGWTAYSTAFGGQLRVPS